MRPPKKPVVLAIAAHPDDIEFRMAGTMLLLGAQGCDLHYFNLSTGSCGSTVYDAAKTRRIRSQEARRAAAILGARWHSPLVDDLEIFYSLELLRKVSAVMRKAAPTIVLTHPTRDYMEDHTNTARLAVTAAFARGMRNFKTTPAIKPFAHAVTVYHCTPHGLRDDSRVHCVPEAFVDTSTVHKLKTKALEAHQSQIEWLEASQGENSFTARMNENSLRVGRMSKTFRHAEGWTRHLALGFCEEEADPLRDILKEKYRYNPAFAESLS